MPCLKGTREIQLSNGGFTLIDEEDYERKFVYRYAPDLETSIWIADRNWRKSSRSGFPYVTSSISIDGKGHNIMIHRLIVGAKYGQNVKHKNSCRLDNRRSNLCLSEAASMFKGVCFSKSRSHQAKPWVAQTYLLGRTIHIGWYGTEREAAIAYDAKAAQLFGSYEVMNGWIKQKELTK